jgi:hypothetical protein
MWDRLADEKVSHLQQSKEFLCDRLSRPPKCHDCSKSWPRPRGWGAWGRSGPCSLGKSGTNIPLFEVPRALNLYKNEAAPNRQPRCVSVVLFIFGLGAMREVDPAFMVIGPERRRLPVRGDRIGRPAEFGQCSGHAVVRRRAGAPLTPTNQGRNISCEHRLSLAPSLLRCLWRPH